MVHEDAIDRKALVGGVRIIQVGSACAVLANNKIENPTEKDLLRGGGEAVLRCGGEVAVHFDERMHHFKRESSHGAGEWQSCAVVVGWQCDV